MARSGLTFGGFADNEGTHPGRWAAVHEALGPLLFRWPVGCLEENIFKLVPEDRIEDLIRDPADELTGDGSERSPIASVSPRKTSPASRRILPISRGF